MDGHQLRNPAPRQVGPDRLEFASVGQRFPDLDGGVRLRIRAFHEQDAFFQCSDRLPLQDTALLKSLGSMFANDILLFCKRLAENNLSVCGYFSAEFSSQHLSLSGQYFGAGLCGHIV
jgi:hypothetical protein